ncbi:unnamed protein product [Blepharisma stoltei]|uniref:Uncharacterized protein n=1 Tax=Blepharisma stoltei TaxID=1481888 RepID=A0AAU9IJ18_9CILI|nr:unnamed protein product [Blepharisma stoltei]
MKLHYFLVFDLAAILPFFGVEVFLAISIIASGIPDDKSSRLFISSLTLSKSNSAHIKNFITNLITFH